MTIDIKYDFVKDVSVRGDVLFVDVPGFQISAGVWSTLREFEQDIGDCRLECLNHVIRALAKYQDEWEFWVVLRFGFPLPDNRITRYWGLAKKLKEREGISFSGSEFIEQAHKHEDGLLYVGAAKWDSSEVDVAHKLMRDYVRAVIILVKKTQSNQIINEVLTNGWPDNTTKPPLEIFQVAKREPIVLIDVYGEFDDRDVAVAAFGRRETLAMVGIGKGRPD